MKSGCIVLGALIAIAQSQASTPTIESGRLLNGLPLRFEQNQGRDAHRGVQFIARGPNFRLALGARESWLEWSANGKAAQLRTRIANANPAARMELENRLPGAANYFLGTAEHWHTAVAGYARVRYREIYPGVDLIFHGEERRLEYDFVVAPNADARAIRLELSGQKSLRVDEDGDLAIATDAGEIRWKAPEVYQEGNGKRIAISGRFVVEDGNAVRFEIGDYDRTRALVIDPTLKYSTYIGGSNNESARGIVVDGSGNIYIGGVTSSPDLKTTQNSYQPNFGGRTALSIGSFTGDGFIAKFTAAGSLVYMTYLGGSRDDGVTALTVDAAGNVYATGGTNSLDFPTVSPYQKSWAGQPGIEFFGDAFIAKLDPTGSTLLAATYLGGNEDDIGTAIVLDKSGNIYICGATASSNFPIVNPLPQGGQFHGLGGEPIRHETDLVPEWEPGDAFVAEFDPTGGKLLFSTFLGGSMSESALSMVIDPSNNLYVGGCTVSTDFPTTPGAYQRSAGGMESQNFFFHLGDGFISKINPSTSSLVYSTYFGGEGDDCVTSIALDSSNAVYMTGTTSSQIFASGIPSGGAQPSYVGYRSLPFDIAMLFGDAFAAKLDPTGAKIQYFTYIGGSNNDGGMAIALDSANNAYILGFTDSPLDFPIKGSALQPQWAGHGGVSQFLFYGDAFLTVVNPTGSAFLYSSYFGGNWDERPFGMALDGAGTVYVAGNTLSPVFPTTANALQRSFSGSKGHANGTPVGDAFLSVFSGLTATGPSITKVANAEGGESTTINANSWVEIKGTNLSQTRREWAGPDFVNNQLPTSLDGVSVSMNGKAAYVYFISSGQINVLTPLDLGSGPISVTVTSGGITSGAFTVQAAALSPAFFVFDATHIVAQHANDLTKDVGPANLFPGLTTPAQSNEVIVMYMNGFGPVNATLIPGALSQSGSLPVLPQMTVSGLPATVTFAGLIFPGEYQFNVQLPPNLPNGDNPVTVTYQGQSTPPGAVLAIQN